MGSSHHRPYLFHGVVVAFHEGGGRHVHHIFDLRIIEINKYVTQWCGEDLTIHVLVKYSSYSLWR